MTKLVNPNSPGDVTGDAREPIRRSASAGAAIPAREHREAALRRQRPVLRRQERIHRLVGEVGGERAGEAVLGGGLAETNDVVPTGVANTPRLAAGPGALVARSGLAVTNDVVPTGSATSPTGERAVAQAASGFETAGR